MLRTGPEAITREESSGAAALWFGVLAAPIAWAIQLFVNETLPEWFACTRGVRPPGQFFGLSTNAWVAIVDGAMLLVALAALLVSLTQLRRLRRADPTPERRALWMATAGVINSTLFSIPIAMGFLPALLLNACRMSP